MKRHLFGTLALLLVLSPAMQAQPAAGAGSSPYFAEGRPASPPAPVADAPAPCGPVWDAPCGGDGAPDRVWADADYLLWWMRGAHLPPLVTTSPAGTPIGEAGVPGAPGTATLFGGSTVNDDARSGVRASVGAWLDDCHRYGIEGDFLWLENKSAGFAASSNGSPILSRPFLDAATGLPAAERIAFPGDVVGSVSASDVTDGLVGAGALFRDNLCCGCNGRVDLLAGYRYLRFADRLAVDEDLTSINPASPSFIVPGTRLAVADRFGAKNEFNGFDVGLDARLGRGPLTLDLLGKVALGETHQTVDIGGATSVTLPGGAPAVSPGGLLALSSNSGHFSRNEFSVVPECDLRVGYQVTPRVRASVGYSYLFWSNVVRAGDQVDLAVNPALLPPATPAAGPQRPAFTFQHTDMWAQGLDVGLEFRY